MDPVSQFVLYPSESDRIDIINHWLRHSSLVQITPDEIIACCNVFAQNPYQTRLEFKRFEKIGYIHPADNYIVNTTIEKCIIGCRVKIDIDEIQEDNTYPISPWIELPSNKIVPPLLIERRKASKSWGSECGGLDDGYEGLRSEDDPSIHFDVPELYAKISKLAAAKLYDTYYFRFKISVDHLSLIVKYMFHCKGEEPPIFESDAITIKKFKSLKDVITDEWVLEFLDMVNFCKGEMIGFLKSVDYMDVPHLRKFCIYWIIFRLRDEGKSEQEIVDYFQRNEYESFKDIPHFLCHVLFELKED